MANKSDIQNQIDLALERINFFESHIQKCTEEESFFEAAISEEILEQSLQILQALNNELAAA